MNRNPLRRRALGLACALVLAGCGSDGDDSTPALAESAGVQTLGSELARTAWTDPLADLSELLPPDSAAATALPPELMPPS